MGSSLRGRVMMRVVCLALCAAVVVANAPIPQNLLNEWSQFKADDQFYDEMNSFLETGTTQGGGDFEFKCETTCQLVQSDGGGAAARSAHSLLQTDEGVAAKRSAEEDVSQQVQDAFYSKMDSFLETQTTTTSGGDFEFKCETTCQLVQATAAANAAASHASRAAANSLLQTDSGVTDKRAALQNNLELEAGVSASTEAAKDCYRLCLNPSMNPGCDQAAATTSLLELGSTTHEKLADDIVAGNPNKNWSLGNGSGNCLNNCVHVCMAVKDPASKQFSPS